MLEHFLTLVPPSMLHFPLGVTHFRQWIRAFRPETKWDPEVENGLLKVYHPVRRLVYEIKDIKVLARRLLVRR